jgi:pyridoxamine 5'-phosphate oxidase
MDLAQLRRDYSSAPLLESEVDSDPVEQFDLWFNQALEAGIVDPNAMTLATATPTGEPSARIVLLKNYDASGFCFFTNYQSAKAEDMAANPRASLMLFWLDLVRQVRITGRVIKTSKEESNHYFAARPRGSQLATWVSKQGQVVQSREELDRLFVEYDKKFEDQEVPLPDYWGGYRLIPDSFEFWQGKINRLHDRLRYKKQDDGAWIIERLAP